MQVELYGVGSRYTGWTWTITLDFEEDRVWRRELQASGTEIIRFRPRLSMGQAYWLKQRLEAVNHGRGNMGRLRQEWVHGCIQLGMKREFISRIRWTRSKTEYLDTASTSSRAPLNDRVLDQLIRTLAGRFLLPEEVVGLMEDMGLGEWKADWYRYIQAGIWAGALELVPGMKARPRRFIHGGGVSWSCRRCGSQGVDLRWVHCSDCGGPCPYCEKCLGMGKIRCCSLLIRTRRKDDRGGTVRPPLAGEQMARVLGKWGLSPAQEAASREALHFLDHRGLNKQAAGARPSPSRFLIWAVTGAGKTEMIFPLLERELLRGGRVLIATPRKDVVLELKPRLEKAFADYTVVALYGGSEDRWEQGQITLSTTHQLLRFYRAFHLVIIDELDAFPYHNNPVLQHAAEQACMIGGKVVLLSATPPKKMQRETKRGRLPYVRVPVRFHRHPLPVPVRLTIPDPVTITSRQSMPPPLRKLLARSVNRGAQVFLFVPKIVLVEPMVRLLKREYPDKRVDGTSSKDEERSDKVMSFRNKVIDILVTTTILERGVTVPKTDVVILGADSSLFDEASLVQMAGRAGRSKEDPAGHVVFASKVWTRSQAMAVKQIRIMNRIAAQSGYLLGAKEKKPWWRQLDLRSKN